LNEDRVTKIPLQATKAW